MLQSCANHVIVMCQSCDSEVIPSCRTVTGLVIALLSTLVLLVTGKDTSPTSHELWFFLSSNEYM